MISEFGLITAFQITQPMILYLNKMTRRWYHHNVCFNSRVALPLKPKFTSANILTGWEFKILKKPKETITLKKGERGDKSSNVMTTNASNGQYHSLRSDISKQSLSKIITRCLCIRH